ncbi:MAG: choice-of-anchor P family protein, partial [Actinomycetota bacterium]
TVNAIHVRSVDKTGKVLVDIVVASASSDASFVSGLGCDQGVPHVSGSGYAVGINADQSLIGPSAQLLDVHVTGVALPSTGGSDSATVEHTGPLSLMGHTILESNAAYSDTNGTVDIASDTAHAFTESQIEKLHLLDQDPDPGAESFLITADAVHAESTSDASAASATSTGDSYVVNLQIAGHDVCTDVGIDGRCHPDANTAISVGPAVLVILNEQIADPSGTGATGLDVNAIHVFILGRDNPLGLPVGAEIIIGHAHSDSKSAEASVQPATPAAASVVITKDGVRLPSPASVHAAPARTAPKTRVGSTPPLTAPRVGSAGTPLGTAPVSRPAPAENDGVIAGVTGVLKPF